MKKGSEIFRGILLIGALVGLSLQLSGCDVVKGLVDNIMQEKDLSMIQDAVSDPDASQAADEFVNSIVGSVEVPEVDTDSVQQIIGSVDTDALFEGLEGVIVNGDTEGLQSVIIQGVEGFDNAMAIIGGTGNSCVKDGAFTVKTKTLYERISNSLQSYDVDINESGYGEEVYTISNRWDDALCAYIKVQYDSEGTVTSVALYATTYSENYNKATFMDIACSLCPVIDGTLDYDGAADMLENAKTVQSASGEMVQAATHNQMQYVISNTDSLIMLYIN